jgi:predicted GTPase
MEGRKRVIILGAAGRDFHDFNVLFRENTAYEVVAFTATQIPFIADRMYPKELSGKNYPNGIRIYDEKDLPELIRKFRVDVCVMAYSDQKNEDVMHKASIANAAGADFWLVAPEKVMLKSTKPVIAVCAVRTGSGKSQTSRYLERFLKKKGYRVVAIRHPMPYGVLKDQIVERFATLKDLDKYKTTIEEREDYEPHIKNGFVVYSGVDYEKILREAEKEADIIIWDGGNNDASFIKPDLTITVADPLRAGDEIAYYPGETVARLANIILINKTNSATKTQIDKVVSDLAAINAKAKIVYGDSIVTPDNPNLIKGKNVLVVEDGPTITHGGMLFGAGTVAAMLYKAKKIINAKQYAVGTIKDTYNKYPHLKNELPAVGYSPKQIKDLENTINRAECDVVVSATPTDLRKIINVDKPIVQVGYELVPRGKEFDAAIGAFLKKI